MGSWVLASIPQFSSFKFLLGLYACGVSRASQLNALLNYITVAAHMDLSNIYFCFGSFVGFILLSAFNFATLPTGYQVLLYCHLLKGCEILHLKMFLFVQFQVKIRRYQFSVFTESILSTSLFE